MNIAKSRYVFSSHSDFWKRFGADAVHVGDTESGKAVFAWRGGLWTTHSVSGACVGYVANRASATDIIRIRETIAASNALVEVLELMQKAVSK